VNVVTELNPTTVLADLEAKLDAAKKHRDDTEASILSMSFDAHSGNAPRTKNSKRSTKRRRRLRWNSVRLRPPSPKPRNGLPMPLLSRLTRPNGRMLETLLPYLATSNGVARNSTMQ
jgi:hypothetical protein